MSCWIKENKIRLAELSQPIYENCLYEKCGIFLEITYSLGRLWLFFEIRSWIPDIKFKGTTVNAHMAFIKDAHKISVFLHQYVIHKAH